MPQKLAQGSPIAMDLYPSGEVFRCRYNKYVLRGATRMSRRTVMTIAGFYDVGGKLTHGACFS